jgi:hypothetical protein
MAYAAADRPVQPSDGSLLDGVWFTRYLARAGRLPDLGRVQAFSFHLHYRVRDDQVVPRRGLALRLAALRRPPYLLVGWRAGRVRVWRVPLTNRRMR